MEGWGIAMLFEMGSNPLRLGPQPFRRSCSGLVLPGVEGDCFRSFFRWDCLDIVLVTLTVDPSFWVGAPVLPDPSKLWQYSLADKESGGVAWGCSVSTSPGHML